MNKYILLFLSVIILFVSNNIQAQITVGSLNEPASFSVLQLDGILGGFRLPQVAETDRDDIDVSSTLANGLMVYNTNTNWVDYWDGTKWAPVSEALVVRNGLWQDGDKVKLGKDLAKNTEINLNGNNLNFIANSSASTFRINTNVLQLKGRDLLFQPTVFSVNSTVFSITGSAIAMKPYNTGAGKLTITSAANNKLTVNDQNVLQEGKLTYVDGKQSDGYVLVASAAGDGYWARLRPNTRIVSGTLTTTSKAITAASTPTDPTIVDITTTTLDLTPGKWMIFANYSTTSSAAATYNRRYVWTYLYKKPQSTGTEEFVTQVGSPASIDSSTDSRLALAKLIYLVDVTEPTSFILKCGTRNRSTTVAAGGTFHAISIIETGQ